VWLAPGLIVALVWGSWAHFDRSFDMTRPMWSRDSTIDIGLPLWPAKLIVPGDADSSLIKVRMGRRDAAQMPPIGSLIVDSQGEALIAEWINNSLSSCL